MPKGIKLMADYECWPLWWFERGEVGNIDPESLPIRPETASRLKRWAETYDSWLNYDDPASGLELVPLEAEAFELEGISLWKQLGSELAPDYEVVYFSKKLGKMLTDPEQL